MERGGAKDCAPASVERCVKGDGVTSDESAAGSNGFAVAEDAFKRDASVGGDFREEKSRRGRNGGSEVADHGCGRLDDDGVCARADERRAGAIKGAVERKCRDGAGIASEFGCQHAGDCEVHAEP